MNNKMVAWMLSLFCLMGVANTAQANGLFVGDVYTQATGVVTVPVSIIGNTNTVTAVNIKISYDSALASLALTDVYAGASVAGWTASLSFAPAIPSSTIKTLQLTYFTPASGISIATIAIADLKFNVLSTAANIPLLLSANATIFSTENSDISAQYTRTSGAILIGMAERGSIPLE